jgi:hypothetical protein
MSTQESGSRSGARRSAFPAATTIGFILLAACSSFRKDADPALIADAAPAENWERSAEEAYHEKEAKEQEQEFKAVNELPFPKLATYDEIQRLLIKHRTPAHQNLKLCRNEVEALAEKIQNVTDLNTERKRITYEVGIKTYFYHWCFYYIMFSLETQLQEDALSVKIADKYKEFHKSIKAMWLLGDALGYNVKTNIYSRQLRSKYVELSRGFFGRDLEASVPFDEYERQELPTKILKPAAPAPAD